MSDTTKTPPRRVMPWDVYFVRLAQMASARSKDPSTQHGCIIVDAETHRVMATGYNGAPAGADDDSLDWGRPAKYGFVIHAEQNAVRQLEADTSCGQRAGMRLVAYVTGMPCLACLSELRSIDIREIVTGWKQSLCVTDEQSEWMAEEFGVHVRRIPQEELDAWRDAMLEVLT